MSDERTDAQLLRRKDDEHVSMFKARAGMGGMIIEGQEIAAVVRYIETLEARVAAAPIVSEWISVSERLPENGQLVAVYDPEHPDLKVWPAQWDEEDQCFIAGHHKSAGWFEKGEVTHWMPLAATPTETK